MNTTTNNEPTVLDPRLFDFGSNVPKWRHWLSWQLYTTHKVSAVSGRPLSEFHLHEGLFPRRVVPSNVGWSWMIFHEYNCFMLLPEEHIPRPPSRIECYWLSVARYGKEAVDEWIDSLPWKVPPERPWRGTYGLPVIADMIRRFNSNQAWAENLISTKSIQQMG